MKRKKILIILGVVIAILALLLAGTYFFKSYDVVFDAQGGTSVAAVRVMEGKTVSEPTTPLLQDYVFDGWYDGNGKYDFSKPVEHSLNLKAHWKSVIQ